MREQTKQEKLKNLNNRHFQVRCMKKNSMGALQEQKPSHLKNELTYEEKLRKEKYDAAKIKEQKFNESREKFTKLKEKIAEERLKLIQIEKE